MSTEKKQNRANIIDKHLAIVDLKSKVNYSEIAKSVIAELDDPNVTEDTHLSAIISQIRVRCSWYRKGKKVNPTLSTSDKESSVPQTNNYTDEFLASKSVKELVALAKTIKDFPLTGNALNKGKRDAITAAFKSL